MDHTTYKTSTINDGNMHFDFGETSKVQKNRDTFLATLNTTTNTVVFADLAHDDTIEIVSKKHAGTVVRADALITDELNLFLALTTADCIPVILRDPEHEVIALVHLGWKPSKTTFATENY